MATMSATEAIPVPSLRHAALAVRRFEECLDFYLRIVGYSLEWRPDDDNAYLSSGEDNLALHRIGADADSAAGALDHLGFALAHSDDVDAIHRWFVDNGVRIENPPKRHRDGAYSFYCRDPDGNRLQFIHHPPIAASLRRRKRPAPPAQGDGA